MSFTQIYYHIVFSTKGRVAVLNVDRRREVYNYMWGILRNNNCHVYRIGGTHDHLHLLFSLHTTVCLADLIRDLKTATTSWIKNNNIYQSFPGWQDRYGGFTQSHAEHRKLIQYIRNQQEHHKNETSLEEFKRLLREHGVDFDERYLE